MRIGATHPGAPQAELPARLLKASQGGRRLKSTTGGSTWGSCWVCLGGSALGALRRPLIKESRVRSEGRAQLWPGMGFEGSHSNECRCFWLGISRRGRFCFGGGGLVHRVLGFLVKFRAASTSVRPNPSMGGHFRLKCRATPLRSSVSRPRDCARHVSVWVYFHLALFENSVWRFGMCMTCIRAHVCADM